MYYHLYQFSFAGLARSHEKPALRRDRSQAPKLKAPSAPLSNLAGVGDLKVPRLEVVDPRPVHRTGPPGPKQRRARTAG